MSSNERSPITEPSAKKMKVNAPHCVLRWAKLTDKAFMPVRGSVRAAGLDLRSAYDVIVPARGRAVAKTDLQVELPQGCYGRVAPRSGLAVKNFIDVGAGVIDEDYRGNVGVVLFNHSNDDFTVNRGDRIAQLICERISYPALEQVEKLEDTERGDGGFGSTGVAELPSKNDSKCEGQQEVASNKNSTKDEKNGTADEKNGTADEKNGDAKEKNGTADEKKPSTRSATADEKGTPAKNTATGEKKTPTQKTPTDEKKSSTKNVPSAKKEASK